MTIYCFGMGMVAMAMLFLDRPVHGITFAILTLAIAVNDLADSRSQ